VIVRRSCMVSARHPLVVADASDAGKAALRAGIACARESRGRLSVVCLLQTPPLWWMGAVPFGLTTPACFAPSATQDAETALAVARTEVPADVPLNTQLLTGRHSHCKQVLHAARVFGCDTIVLAAPRLFLGMPLGVEFALMRRSELSVQLIHVPCRDPESIHATLAADHEARLEGARGLGHQQVAGATSVY
jgi:hypothetical protein